MIFIDLFITSDGCLKSCVMKGHAGFAKAGFDIVCSACTILVRTTIDVISANQDIDSVLKASQPGELEFYVEKFVPLYKDFLIYAGLFLRKGFESLCSEYPCNISLRVHTE